MMQEEKVIQNLAGNLQQEIQEIYKFQIKAEGPEVYASITKECSILLTIICC